RDLQPVPARRSSDLLAERQAFRADAYLRIERAFHGLVRHELARADEPHAARLADQRVVRQRLQPRLKMRRDAANVLVEAALLVRSEEHTSELQSREN